MFKTIISFIACYSIAFATFSQNLVRNGDFEQGYAHFASDLRYMSFSDRTAGVYTVGSNPNNFQVEFSNCAQHTPNGQQMLIVNGSTVPNTIVWRQTTNVRANKTYNLSFWYSNIVPWLDDLKLEFWVNDTRVAIDTYGDVNGCQWNKVQGTWTSNSIDTVVTFKIVDAYNLFNGNDFAIDDIEVLAACAIPATIDAGETTTFCPGGNVALNANTGTGLTYQWQRNGANIPNATNASYIASDSGSYNVIVANRSGCFGTSAAVRVNILPKPIVNFAYILQTGTGNVIQFTNSSSTGSVRWSFGDPAQSTSTLNTPTFRYANNGSYQVKLRVTTAEGCIDSTAKPVVITGVRVGTNDLKDALKMTVYPSAFSSHLTVETNVTPVEAQFVMVNAMGQTVYQTPFNKNQWSIDTQNWANGVYQAYVSQNGQLIPIQKIVKTAF